MVCGLQARRGSTAGTPRPAQTATRARAPPFDRPHLDAVKRGADQTWSPLPRGGLVDVSTRGVYNCTVSPPQAVLDTSFWSAAVHVGVDAYLPLFFARPMLVPKAVVREIERVGEGSTGRLREDQQRFRLWLEDGRLWVWDPRRAYPRFGAGEAACLGLALEQRALALLINEAKGYAEAGRTGLTAFTVPGIVARLAREGRISRQRAQVMLDVLEDTTGADIVDRARGAIAEGGRQP